MCSARRPRIMCTIGLYAMDRCVLVHLVIEDFGLVCFPQNYWEDLVVDCLPAVNCFLGFRVGYSWLSLVAYWRLASWDGFVVQTPIPMEQGRGLEQLVSMVHSRLGWMPV